MANRAVEILIAARDTATAPMRAVRTSVQRLATSMRAMASAVPTAALRALRTAAVATLGPMLKLMAVLAPFLAIAGAIRAVTQSLADFGRQEAAVRNLATALELTGNNAASSLPGLERFASELQQVTTVGDEAALELMRQGLMLGIHGDQIKAVTQAAIGLSEAIGIDQERAMLAVARAREGDFGALQRYIPALRTATSDAERMAIVNEFAARGFELAKSQADTYAGSMQQLSNAIGDTREAIGAALAPALIAVAKAIQSNVLPAIQRGIQWVTSLSNVWRSVSGFIVDGVRRIHAVFSAAFSVIGAIVGQFASNVEFSSGTVVSVIDNMNRGAEVLARGFIIALSTIEFAIENWRHVLSWALLRAQLGVVQFVESVKHFFTTVIPTTIMWMADNWLEILVTLGANTLTFFENLGSNIVNIIKAIPDIVAGRVNISDMWQPLTDGFVNVIGEFPEIADREIGQLEKMLAADVAMMGAHLGDGLKTKIEERLAALEMPGVNTGRVGEDVEASVFIGLTDDARDTIAKGLSLDTARTQADESRFLSGRQTVQVDAAIKTQQNTDRLVKNGTRQQQIATEQKQLLQRLADNSALVQIGSF